MNFEKSNSSKFDDDVLEEDKQEHVRTYKKEIILGMIIQMFTRTDGSLELLKATSVKLENCEVKIVDHSMTFSFYNFC